MPAGWSSFSLSGSTLEASLEASLEARLDRRESLKIATRILVGANAKNSPHANQGYLDP